MAKDPSLPPLPNPDNNIDLPGEVGASQPIKNPSLATVYQRMGFTPRPGEQSVTGFGLLHDGTGSTLPTTHPYILDELTTLADFADVSAFVLSFGTGTAPAVGESHTVTKGNATTSQIGANLDHLERQSSAGDSDLVARGVIGGKQRSFVFDKVAKAYVPDSSSEAALSRADLLALLDEESALTFLGTQTGEGQRLGRDRDRNGVSNADEPQPGLTITRAVPGTVRLGWPNPTRDWLLQFSSDLEAPWQPVTRSPVRNGGTSSLDEPTLDRASRFYRLRRTW
jgi:hypothetical protein